MKLIITLLTLIISVSSITTDLLWKKPSGPQYYRPHWGKNITIEINDNKKNIRSVKGIIIPLYTDPRPSQKNPYNNCYINNPCIDGHCIYKDYNRGHIMGLRNGGPHLSENIVPQWGKWQGAGGVWYDFEEYINEESLDFYDWNKTPHPMDLCMNETQNNCIKEPINKVYWEINLIYEDNNCEPVRYEGFIFFGEKKYTFDFVNNGTEKITLKPIEKIPNDDESSLIPWIFVFIVLSIWICVYFIYKKITHTISMNEIILTDMERN